MQDATVYKIVEYIKEGKVKPVSDCSFEINQKLVELEVNCSGFSENDHYVIVDNEKYWVSSVMYEHINEVYEKFYEEYLDDEEFNNIFEVTEKEYPQYNEPTQFGE